MSKHVLCVFWQNIYNLTHCCSVSTRHLVQNTHKLTMSTPWLTSEGEVWGVFCEFNLWPKFVIMVQNTISPKWQFLMNYVHGFKWYCYFDNVRCGERHNKIVKMATFRSSELFCSNIARHCQLPWLNKNTHVHKLVKGCRSNKQVILCLHGLWRRDGACPGSRCSGY